MKKIAVMGHGVVGSGVVEVLYKNRESIQKKAGTVMDIKYILDLRDFPDLEYSDKFNKDFNIIAEDDEIEIVVEVMGGINPAYDFVKTCLLKGKSVVTSNKELVAAKGAELLKIARQNGVNFLFEASVGGGIPIIRPLHQCLAANEIREIAGILNGTTNFILTKMVREQMDFDTALKLAQELGYAERNPAADVEGHDACRKICILSSLSFGKHIYPDDVKTEGITNLTLTDVEYAENWGGVIKLIGNSKMLDSGKLSVRVAPAFVSFDSQLSSVDDVFNAILVRGDAIGDVVFYGRGAGKLPTASAVVADVIEEAKNPNNIKSLYWEDSEENIVEDYKNVDSKYYIRTVAEDANGAKEVIKNLFGEVSYLTRKDKPENEFAFVTNELLVGKIESAVDELAKKNISVLASIRVLDY